MKRACLYVRVSTDKQSVESQIQTLTQIAERRGWQIVETYNDAGISGAKGRDKRPGLDKMLNDAQRRRFDIVMSWAIDRLGRSLIDLLDTIRTLEQCGVGLYIDQQSLDTTTPGGKAMLQMCGVFAEFERSMIQQRVQAGIRHAQEHGTKSGRAIGRPEVTDERCERATALLQAGRGINGVAKEVGLSNSVVSRLKAGIAGGNGAEGPGGTP